ncbi:uncharacterized protein LOC132305202 [Cornus florida]|uniref:uncharacterized protein LOC132305202 n=1 Tax=Cornus florida TaxID=4283 RepID=UPI00289E58F6|nr:uncharacterized protein LOC132305202 [Cornus florida]
MDFITCLPKSKGCGSIIVVVDRFSKYATFIPTLADCKAERVVELFVNHVVKLWGVPQNIVSDRDLRFTVSSDINKAVFYADTISNNEESDGRTNMASASVSSRKSQKTQESCMPFYLSLHQINAANKNAVMLDEFSDDDEEFDQEVFTIPVLS